MAATINSQHTAVPISSSYNTRAEIYAQPIVPNQASLNFHSNETTNSIPMTSKFSSLDTVYVEGMDNSIPTHNDNLYNIPNVSNQKDTNDVPKNDDIEYNNGVTMTKYA
ncbi:hypothetical protein WA158_004676 [Blastocystis sp. Blastoise]